MSTANRAAGHVTRFFQVLGTAVLLVMTVHIVVNALSRSWWSAPIPSTIEVVSYWYMPAVAFLGIVLAQVDRSLTEARLVFDRLSPRLQREVHLGGQLLAAGLSAALAWYGFTEALDNWRIGLTGGVGGLVIWPTTFLAPLCFGVLTVLFAVSALRGPTYGAERDIL